MNVRITAVTIIVISALLSLLIPASAAAYTSAPLTFCNRTSSDISIAVGYHSPGVGDPADHSLLTGPFVSQGYWDIDAGQCLTIDNPFGARYMFWFAWGHQYNSDDRAVVATRTSDGQHFCTSNYFATGRPGKVLNFTYEDENASLSACDQAGGGVYGPANRQAQMLWVAAKSVDTWVNPTVNFTGQ